MVAQPLWPANTAVVDLVTVAVALPARTANGRSMLVQRRRRWTRIETALRQKTLLAECTGTSVTSVAAAVDFGTCCNF